MQSNLGDGVLWYAVFLGSTVCHEAGHAWAALRLGDDTASRGGQVSLNPIPHIKREPVGMVVMPILSWLLGGWMMGWASAPYNAEWARTHPRRAGLMAIAGPAANLILVVLAVLLLRLGLAGNVFMSPYSLGMSRVVTSIDGGAWEIAAKLLSITFSLNLLLFVFNLLPIPPLDGSSVLLLALPENLARRYFDALRSPALQLIGFVIVMRGFGAFFPPIFLFVLRLLFPGSFYR
jgi:Zn-dependent protease